jgi:hypothetical protein
LLCLNVQSTILIPLFHIQSEYGGCDSFTELLDVFPYIFSMCILIAIMFCTIIFIVSWFEVLVMVEEELLMGEEASKLNLFIWMFKFTKDPPLLRTFNYLYDFVKIFIDTL